MLMVVMAATPAAAQTFTVLYSFDSTSTFTPEGFLVQGIDGNLYGTTFQGRPPKIHGSLFKISTGGTLTSVNTQKRP
jgi:hypothetical protein